MKEIFGAFKCNFETSNVKQTGNCVVVFSVDLVSSNLIKFYQEKKKKETYRKQQLPLTHQGRSQNP
jgi:hypothetical protein